MKTSLKILLTVISLALGTAIPLARAADATAPANKGRPNKEQTARPDNAFNRLQAQLQPLNLTDEQKVKVDAIVSEAEKAAAGLRKDKGVSKEDRQAARQELQKDTLAKIREVLTPEQAAQLGKHGKHGKGKDKPKVEAESAATP